MSFSSSSSNINSSQEEKSINHENEEQAISPNFKKIKRTYYQLIPVAQKVLKKLLRNRTPKDISDLYEFLENTRFSFNMRDEIEEGHLDLQQLLFFSTQFMSIKTYNNKDIIYYEGDLAENIYVLIKGEVNLFKLQSSIREMRAYDYYRFLHNMYLNSKDLFLLNKTVKANKKIFPVFKNNDIQNFNEILFQVRFCELLYEGDIQKIFNFLSYNKKNIEDYEFKSIQLGEMSMNDYFQKTLSSLNESEDFYFTHVRNVVKKVKILTNLLSKTLEEKEYFGKFRLEDEGNIRRETAICEKDGTLLLVINKKLYSGCITTEQREVKQNEIDKVYYGTIFMSIRRFNFDKYYFYNLEKIEYSKGEEIFSENEKVNYIYLLRNGLVEAYLPNKNIFDIKKLIQKFKEFDLSFQKREFDDTLKLKNSLTSLHEYIKIKNNYSLYICNTRERFGVWEYKYNNRNSLYSVKIKSDKATLYRMPIDNFLDEKKDNDKVPDIELLKKGIKKDAFEQIKHIIERLIFIKNSVLMKIDFEYTKKFQDKVKEFIPKLNIFEVKNIKALNHDIKINKHLINLLKGNKTPKLTELKHFNSSNNNNKNNNISNLKRFIYHRPFKNYNSLSKEKYKVHFSDDSFENSKSLVSIRQIKNNYSRNLFIEKQFQSELYNLKNDMSKDSFLCFQNPLSSQTISLPKIKSPQRIQSPIYLRMKTELSKDNLKKRSNSNKNKEILLKPSMNSNESRKNINYLAIKEFYNNFYSSQKKDKVKRHINKSVK